MHVAPTIPLNQRHCHASAALLFSNSTDDLPPSLPDAAPWFASATKVLAECISCARLPYGESELDVRYLRLYKALASKRASERLAAEIAVHYKYIRCTLVKRKQVRATRVTGCPKYRLASYYSTERIERPRTNAARLARIEINTINVQCFFRVYFTVAEGSDKTGTIVATETIRSLVSVLLMGRQIGRPVPDRHSRTVSDSVRRTLRTGNHSIVDLIQAIFDDTLS